MRSSPTMFTRAALTNAALTVMLWAAGCAAEPRFLRPLHTRAASNETVFAFDTDDDKRADFWQYQGPDGRKAAVAYADPSGQPGPRISLDDIRAADCPHFVIALDGVPFELVDELYRAGQFRLFYPPARVICCFPGMTDLALAELFHCGPCEAYQALHFDRQANRVVSGNSGYLAATNSPWVSKMNYRCSFWWDALAYLRPQTVFQHELNGIARTFRQIASGQACAYSVGTAGLGTRGGAAAIRQYLRTIDRLCEQIVYERRGRVKLTLLADHGHNLVRNRRVSFRDTLRAAGYGESQSLRGPGDVVVIAYGLVTYAEVFTRDPAGVAECLAGHEDVEFVCYRSGPAIIVQDRTGRAWIRKGAGGFYYEPRGSDPLKLVPILERLRQDRKIAFDGEIDDRALFEATLDHYYPDPLARIWRAFHVLARNPPDVIVNLRDGACHGSRFFDFMIGGADSTHGSLNRRNSTTFALTMLGELPPALRASDVLPALEHLRRQP